MLPPEMPAAGSCGQAKTPPRGGGGVGGGRGAWGPPRLGQRWGFSEAEDAALLVEAYSASACAPQSPKSYWEVRVRKARKGEKRSSVKYVLSAVTESNSGREEGGDAAPGRPAAVKLPNFFCRNPIRVGDNIHRTGLGSQRQSCLLGPANL